MAIKDRITEIKKYFRGMQIVADENNEQIIYITVEFPQKWHVDKFIEEVYDVTIINGEYPNTYYFATKLINGEDNIFDAIEYNITKIKEAIERSQLLQSKIIELTNIFKDESIDIENLRNLTFNWGNKNDSIISASIISPEPELPNMVETMKNEPINDENKNKTKKQ